MFRHGDGGQVIVTDAVSGQKFSAYAAGAIDAPARVLIMHDWFGVTDFTRESVDRLGAQGIRAMAVDLYRGQVASTHERASELFDALDSDYAHAAALAGLYALGAEENPTAIIGYSAGGNFAFRAAAEYPQLVAASAVIYGGGFEVIDDTSLANAGPILVVTGAGDDWAYGELVGFEKRMRGLGRHLESYVYPGVGHAFAQPLYDQGRAYDEMATQAMHNVLDHFLERHLGIAT